MNLNCVICAELFMPSDDVYVTLCGHMFHHSCLLQWLQRSKTCPQCRNKCSDRNIHKVYFNLANLDTSRVDVGSLQQHLDNANLQIKIGEKDFQKSQKEIRDLKDIQKKTMKTINALEDKLKQNSFLILSYNERMKMLKVDAKIIEDLRKEVKDLKQQIEHMESLSTILSASQAEADKLLKEENDPKALSLWVSTLKRELRGCESKKTDLRNIVKVVQHDLRKEQELKKLYEERISLLESENYRLSEKIKSLENGIDKSDVPLQSLKSGRSQDDVEITTPLLSQPKRKMAVLEYLNTPSPGISEKVKRIEESNSPYLKIKSCSLGLPLLKLGNIKLDNKANENESGNLRNANSNLSEKYSIFKKPRLAISSISQPMQSSNLVFNGMGGSEKRQFDSNQACEQIVKDTKKNNLSSRLKAGKLRKFPSAGT